MAAAAAAGASPVGGPRVEKAPFRHLEVVGDDDAAVAPAPPQQGPAPQARRLDADQQRDEEIDREARLRGYAEASQAELDEPENDQVDDQDEPQPPPDHPQRAEQERRPAEPFAQEHEPVGVVGGAATRTHRRLEHRESWHGMIPDLRPRAIRR